MRKTRLPRRPWAGGFNISIKHLAVAISTLCISSAANCSVSATVCLHLSWSNKQSLSFLKFPEVPPQSAPPHRAVWRRSLLHDFVISWRSSREAGLINVGSDTTSVNLSLYLLLPWKNSFILGRCVSLLFLSQLTPGLTKAGLMLLLFPPFENHVAACLQSGSVNMNLSHPKYMLKMYFLFQREEYCVHTK